LVLGFSLGHLAPRLQGAPVDERLRDALGRLRCLHFTYAGHVRLVEPHALGVTPGGHRALLAWQFGGTSRSQPPTGWRTFLLSEIQRAQLTVRGFTPRADYRRETAGLRAIELDVHSAKTADNPHRT